MRKCVRGRSNRSYRTYVEYAMRIARNGMQYWRGELENCPTGAIAVSKLLDFFPEIGTKLPPLLLLLLLYSTHSPEGPVSISFSLTRDFRFHDTQ